MYVCPCSHVCSRTSVCGAGLQKFGIFLKKIVIVIKADRRIFYDYRSRSQVIEHNPNRQLRNHIIAVPLGIIYSQTSVVI